MLDNLQETELISRIHSRPLTVEIIERIEDAIRDGLYKPGQQLPSEPTLAQQLGVSRNTLREALKSMIDKGLLSRNRGVGTFVTFQPDLVLTTSLDQVVSTSDVIRGKGQEPGQRNFTWSVEKLSETVATRLRKAPGDLALCISRLRTANKVPVILSEEYIPLELVDVNNSFGLEANDNNWSVYKFLAQHGYEVTSVVTHIRAVTADRKLARLLEIKEGQPLLRLDQLHFSKFFPNPVLYCTNFHNYRLIDVTVYRKG
jgi:GntR family transcriptional regulator